MGVSEPWQLMMWKETGGPAFTAMEGDIPIACGGIVIVWSGVGIAWTVISDAARKHGLLLTKAARRILDDVVRSHALRRIDAMVVDGDERNARWIQVLGFSPENGRANRYMPNGDDAIRYERLAWKL